MKNWTRNLLMGFVFIYLVAILAVRFGGFYIPSSLWIALCLIGYGSFMFLLMGLFTKSNCCEEDCSCNYIDPKTMEGKEK